MTNHSRGLSIVCGAALFFLAACKLAPDAPTGVTATPGNTEAILSWPAVKGATSYNVYTSPSAPVTTGSTRISVATPGVTLSSLANGAVVYAAITAVNAAGESPLSTMVCAVPTAASTAGLTLHDPLCGSTLDGRKWSQTPLFTRGIVDGALVLSSRVGNMESRTVQGQVYSTTATVDSGTRRVTTLKADVTVPAATASRTGSGEIRAMLQILYQPPATRLAFPGGLLDGFSIQVGLADSGSGLRAVRRVFHCDDASCASRSASGVVFLDPAAFSPDADGTQASAAASYDTTYTLTASLDESTGVLSWSVGGGSFGAGVSGTADPSAYLAGNASWTALGANPLAGSGFLLAVLRTQALDVSTSAGSEGGISGKFQNVHVGLDNAAATLWDDFSGTAGSSGPTELSDAKWTVPGKDSAAMGAGSLVGHVQATSLPPSGAANFQPINLADPASLNTLQVDAKVVACGNSLPGTNRVGLAGEFYNDGTPGTTPPNINQPNSRVGDITASLYLDCIAGVARFQVTRFTTQSAQTLLSNFATSTVPMGPAAILGNTHTLTMKWDPAARLLTFQVDGSTPVVVDPTTVNAHMLVAAPYVAPANAPLRQLFWFVSMAPGATASVDFTANNVFTAP